jgi:periplasmic protein TonB
MEGRISWRHMLALVVTLTSAWLIWNGTHLILTEPDRLHRTPLMHVSLAHPPAPPAPAPPKVVPKLPKPVVAKQPARQKPVETSPHAIGPSVATNAPVAPTASASPPTPAEPQAPPANMSLQSTYIASVHAAIEQQKRYPMTKEARLQQPSGTATVWFVLNRAGELQGSGIEESAGGILDRAALESVHRAAYPPFPPTTWSGEEQHTFVVPIHFSPS